MDLNSFDALLTPSGQEALQAAVSLQPEEVDFLRHYTMLSRQYPADLARTALETAILRREAERKFPFAGKMYFTRPALEQASSFAVSSYRSGRFAGYQRLIDLGCSIGADTLALARLAPTLGVDLDLLRLAMARANLQALGLGEQGSFLQADLNAPLPLRPRHSTALFFDPARRAEGRRIFSVQDYLPSLKRVFDWEPAYPDIGVKISPGVNLDELRPYDAEVEFISLGGELKEAVLWFGSLRTTRRKATLLPGPFSLASDQTLDELLEQRGRILPLAEPKRYLYEPDAAVLRAGLVETLGIQLDAAQLDPDIAYLTSDRLVQTPFARVWPVEDWLPFSMKKLRSALRQRNVGQVVVKKRGSPLSPEALVRELRLSGSEERVVFLTHLRGRPIVILAMGELVKKGTTG